MYIVIFLKKNKEVASFKKVCVYCPVVPAILVYIVLPLPVPLPVALIVEGRGAVAAGERLGPGVYVVVSGGVGSTTEHFPADAARKLFHAAREQCLFHRQHLQQEGVHQG